MPGKCVNDIVSEIINNYISGVKAVTFTQRDVNHGARSVKEVLQVILFLGSIL